jgi:hypothetical protein
LSAHRRSLAWLTSGKAPHGFKWGPHGKRRYAPETFTRRIGKWVVKWRLGGKTWEEMYWGLIRQGERNRHGKEWSIGALRRMFSGECRLLQSEPRGPALLARWQKEGRELYEARLAKCEAQRSIRK